MTGSAAFPARPQRRKALLLALLVLAQLLATAHGKRQPRPADGGGLQAPPLADSGAAAPSGRRLPKRFRDPALAEADALARIAANQPAELIVSFKVSKSDIKQQESQIANSLGLAAADAAAPAAAEPLSKRALRREARMRANAAVKQRVLSRRAARKGARLKRDFTMLPVALLSVNSSEALQALQSDPSVASVEPRIMFTITGRGLRDQPPLERGFGDGALKALGVDGGGGGRRRLLLKESLPMIGAPEAAAAGYTGKGCAVAVIDTGADYTQPDLGSCTKPGQPAATCRVSAAHDIHLSDDYDDGELDDSGHGTNVASIVARAATESQIIALDVFRWFDDSGGGQFLSADYADIVGAIDWVLKKKDELGICVINMSLGSPCLSGNTKVGCPACPERAIAQALASARAAGVLAAVASGNDGLSTGLSIPACAPAAVSVGAVYDAAVAGGLQWGLNPVTCTDRTVVKEQIACFSNSFSYLTVLAPGAMITAGGQTMGGTSQASPHVAATLAVLRAAFKNATLDAAVEALTTTGKALTDPRNSVTKPLINMLQAANKMAEGASIPVGTVRINGGAQWTSSRTVALVIQASGATQMCVASEAAAPCTPYEPYTTSKAWQLSDGDGEKGVFVYFKNAAGTVSDPPANASITLDATAPSGPALSINGGAQSTSSPQVTLAISGTDNNPASLQMCLANAQTTAEACTPYEPFAATKNHTLPAGAGSKTVFLWLRDAAGNAASAQAQITLLVVPSGSVAINGGAVWTNTPSVILNITAGEGVTEACVANTAVDAAACQLWEAPVASKAWQLPDGDGEKGVFVYFKNAGNETGGPATAIITLDATAPSGAALSIDGGAQSTSSPQVTLAISGTDNNPASLQMCLSNAQTTAEACTPYEPFAATKNHTLPAGAGSKTVFLWLRDAAGNAASAQAQITLLVAPSGSVAINSGAVWTNTPSVILNITAGEGVTEACVANTAVGAAACQPWEAPVASKAWQLPDGEGEKGVFVYFKNAGNETGGPATAIITVDSTPPVNASLTINGGAEWAAGTDVNLTIGGSDNYPAGLQMCLTATQTAAAGECTPYEAFAASKVWQLLAGEGERTVFLWLRDAAGSSAGASASIKLDTQAPSGVAVSINGGAAETASLDVSVAITAGDFSGVASMCIKTATGALCSEGDFVAFASPAAVKLPAGALGARYVYVTLRDALGNTMSAPASDQITYNDPSVPSDVTVSVANANSNGWVTSSDVLIAVSGTGAASVTEICVREDEAACTAFSPFVNPTKYTLSSGPDGDRALFVTLRTAVPPANGTLSALGGGYGLTLPLDFMADFNPPSNTRVSLSSGTGSTATPHVSLAVAATDVSGVKEVCITDEPEATAASCQPWRDFNPTQSFTLASSEGASEVLAFFRDGNNHVSSGVAANVTIDKSKPKAKKRNMDMKATPSSSSITLTWSKDGATDDISDVSGFFVLYRPNYTPNSCERRRKRTKLVNAAIGAGSIVSATVKDLKPGKRYGFRVCAVDAAGNVGGGVTLRASTKSARGK
ncbi:peptidase S8 [Raphidocelis subcapitata]|uniref:Peptidase S8 n=1 Tax=Raphidocelis subcapitata TaxID=307507 RepID=A0A2V0NNX8_9CHLO|nr:peptidase S8 [Raphidocelis subcapitata]|eukprot:GBF89308.1 peptidase S8 [Raphidocelis subcapitata]